jgi:lipopolysaccharide/colanic/teichoic acid biosynthesis glycosyltransferase
MDTAPSTHDALPDRQTYKHLPLIEARPATRLNEPHAAYDVSKRCLDIALSLVLLLPALSVSALASLVIWLSTGDSPLLLQRRVGYEGREFRMLKLRTMARAGSSGGSPAFALLAAKQPNDERVTAVGRFLRRTSMDELPQLLNVLAGQMSLVGPRPALPLEVAQYPASWRRNLRVRPGLTGLWQVSGRSTLGPRRRATLDRLYVRRRSLRFDALILLRTIGVTLSMRGAW